MALVAAKTSSSAAEGGPAATSTPEARAVAVRTVSSLVVLDMLHSLVSFLINRTDFRLLMSLVLYLLSQSLDADSHDCFGDMIFNIAAVVDLLSLRSRR